MNRPRTAQENSPDAELETQSNTDGPMVFLTRTLADGLSDLLRYLKNFVETADTRSLQHYVVLPAFPTATELPPREPGESQVAHFLAHLRLAMRRVVTPTDPSDVALAKRDIPGALMLAQPGFPAANLLMLGPVSKW